MKQADLASLCGISASYLNLIEHNRRRIGGALLNRIADALQTDPSQLNDGITEDLRISLEAAADANSEALAEREQAEELAGRFPGWARLIDRQRATVRRLEQVVERLDDRMAHDPFLSASLHNVLTSVTAIRSASAILAGGDSVEPEWQARFHRNIYEDSQRLAETAETLAGYLGEEAEDSRHGSLPQDEVQNWLVARAWEFEELESDPGFPADQILNTAPQLRSRISKELGRRLLEQYAADAATLPKTNLAKQIGDDTDPVRLASSLGLPLPLVFRRLAAMGPDVISPDRSFGLVGCDAAGGWIFRKPLEGFEIPRYGNGCPLWPLFQAMLHPQVPVRAAITIGGRDEGHFSTSAISEISHPLGYEGARVVTGWMLVQAVPIGEHVDTDQRVGISCRICSESNCPARREPSVFAKEPEQAL